jgi:predicted RNA-binding protein with PUA-like domain
MTKRAAVQYYPSHRSMNYFLAKTEPSAYSIDRLRADDRTTWDGVRNPQAVKAIRTMRPGDRVLIYHSGGESAIVGLAEVTSEPRPDPNDPKSAVVDLRYVAHIHPPVSLAEVKATKQFDDWALVRQGRLSTMPVPADFVEWIRERFPGSAV